MKIGKGWGDKSSMKEKNTQKKPNKQHKTLSPKTKKKTKNLAAMSQKGRS